MPRPSRRVDLEIGPTIRSLRLERGLTLDQLASRAGISPSHLSRLERNQADPSFYVAAAIAREIGITLSDLLPANQRTAANGS